MDISSQVNALNDDTAKEDGMVYQVWEDGEITLQKGGRLLWQRSLHTIVPGNPSRSLGTALVHKDEPHSYIFCKSKEDAEKASRLIQPDNIWLR